MASSGSLKGGAVLRSGSLRQVSVRGFENLAQGDSTLFRPEAGSNADVDEAYIVAARAATLKLQMGNAKATAAKPPIRAGSRGRVPFREASAGRVAGLFDLSPDSARAIMEHPADNTPPARHGSEPSATPSSVLTPSASAKSETSSEGEVSPEKASAPAEAGPTAEAAPAAAARCAPNDDRSAEVITLVFFTIFHWSSAARWCDTEPRVAVDALLWWVLPPGRRLRKRSQERSHARPCVVS